MAIEFKKNPLWVIIPVNLLVLFTPLVWRLSTGNDTLVGEYTYYSLSQLTSFLNLSLSSVVYWLLAITLTFVLTMMYYRLIKLHTDSYATRIAASLFFVFTPITIYLSMSVSPYLIALILIFSTLNLIESRYGVITIFPLIGLLFFDWITFLSTIIILCSYLFYSKRVKSVYFVIPYAIVFIVLGLFIPHKLVIEILPSASFLVNFISDFGSVHGIGIFIALLALLGLAVNWYDKIKLIPVYVAGLVFLILFFLAGVSVLFFLYPLVILLASSAFIYFWRRRWTLSVVRTLTLAILAYGILFSGLAYTTRMVESLPTPDVFHSTAWLANHPFYSNAIVLSHPQKGFWIEYNTDNVAFVHYGSDYYEQRLNVTESILNSRDFKKTVSLMEDNNISLIWIDQKMKSGQVWNEEDDGLLFLLNNERFLRVYNVGEVEIWRFK